MKLSQMKILTTTTTIKQSKRELRTPSEVQTNCTNLGGEYPRNGGYVGDRSECREMG